MPLLRPFSALVMLAASVTALSFRETPLLPEVKQHLAEARSALRLGEHGKAMAHAGAVIVGDEITFSVDAGDVSRARAQEFDRAVSRAVVAWEDALQGTVKFRRVSGGGACLRIVFRPDVRLHNAKVAGVLDWKRKVSDSSFECNAELRVRTVLPDASQEMTYDSVRQVVTHEIGHLFGLEDTDVVGDLMGPLNFHYPLLEPTRDEAMAAMSLRREALRIRLEAQVGAR